MPSDRVLRLVLRPIFANLSLKGFRSRLDLEGYRSQSQGYCLETFNTATTLFKKTSVIQHAFVCCISRQKTAKVK